MPGSLCLTPCLWSPLGSVQPPLPASHLSAFGLINTSNPPRSSSGLDTRSSSTAFTFSFLEPLGLDSVPRQQLSLLVHQKQTVHPPLPHSPPRNSSLYPSRLSTGQIQMMFYEAPCGPPSEDRACPVVKGNASLEACCIHSDTKQAAKTHRGPGSHLCC